MKEVWKLVKIW